MVEQKADQKDFNTCLEDGPFAEMLQKISGQQGIGSLCAGMMKNFMEKQGDGGSSYCAEMMQSMMKNCCDIKEELKEAKKEEGHVRGK